jgi:hypothetical protein
MASNIPIHNISDITAARNLLRKKITGTKWSPTFRARAAIALTAIGEFILRSKRAGMLDVSVIMGQGTWGVELRCDLSDSEGITAGEVRHQLMRITDDVQMQSDNGHLNIIARMWIS